MNVITGLNQFFEKSGTISWIFFDFRNQVDQRVGWQTLIIKINVEIIEKCLTHDSLLT